MKRSRITIIVIVCVLAIPVASVAYKAMLGFYGFKKQMCEHMVPRELRVVELEIPSQIESRVDLSKFHRTNVSGVREWFLQDSPEAVSLLETAYGSWISFRREYPTDKNVLDATIGKRLPSYLRRNSLSMRPPVGYYILPLFPPPKDYRKEYALFGTKAILSDVSLPFMTAEGEAYYFFVLRGDRSAEIVYGGKASGNIIGSVLIVRSVTEKQIADICHQVEETANN